MPDPVPSGSAPAALPSQKLVLFARGVIARLALWAALRIAVKENWGDPSSADTSSLLASEIVEAFDDLDHLPDVTDIEELLLQIMEEEFDTLLEDDSARSVAQDVLRLWDDISNGKADLLTEFETRADKIKGKDVQADQGVPSDPEEEWSESDEEEEDVPMLVDTQLQPPSERPPREEPEVDEDGFTVVKKKGKR
ncbi:hypothetical protein OE88DRAFT_1655486 [Heliocybe sulcata]|uniref:Pre-rRNA-processing protein TSR2 n=1 Tax=Heliocybe sulcata TaxID=5364 RepID=A0A5C3NIE1_9AGAM|nr:hypothetical protein OE88DRAFT_1655486 [Heliocybe sulcata]